MAGKAYLPSRRIEPGAKTDEPIRTRGWTLASFVSSRQLLWRAVVEKDVHAITLNYCLSAWPWQMS
jgi:hypothetical protein